ncbi:cry-dash from the cryptochrome/photolyase family [Phaeodactylum tricornutum CCAP 1055/1]|uniref:Cryptochrome DASH n=1 Tax=Phaeodactylum tricornutum (strain CCAP 1055/1) TaxID=556484 RepID=B7FV99_PHATC|nr:cry-dash from the cryptochrome/photolyase family [Phaeodactylum tricornutum CCAP 1055/1]EEC49587.1 cry-dash from the cryptochrome/photolyase family [Phaeodactylum tricornutum CCAP 1055/1]|eukprot:XP_002178889.1 cry-dash from the cryptochrome/photolyase family [Phaeodactylum tricornutum CCAP 1055/1]
MSSSRSKQSFWFLIFVHTVLILTFAAGAATAMRGASVSTVTKATSRASSQVVLHWFRHGDLRLLDNPALIHSSKTAESCVPVFCFDDSVYGNDNRTPDTRAPHSNDRGQLKCGPRRAQFVLDSVQDLRRSLQSRGSALYVAHGKPAQVFQRLVDAWPAVPAADTAAPNGSLLTIVCQREVVREENDAVRAVQSVLRRRFPQAKVQQIWGSTMYELDDLPFATDLANMPDTFTPFRNKVEKNCQIGTPLPVPKQLSLPENFPSALKQGLEYLPTLKELGYTDAQIQQVETHDERGVLHFMVAKQPDSHDCLKDYFETRNGMLGPNYSTKFSPWLAHGNVSPRYVAAQCRKYEEERVENKSTYWVVFELLWRDFCKFFATKHGDAIFYPYGTTERTDRHKPWSTFGRNLQAWQEGRTGYPLVDANMRELVATGFMSNRGRQNVASFLAINLNHDWRCGGDFFESHLLDYDVYSNWVNWCAAAGMTGGRLNRFNISKQSKDYDQHGDYVRHWLPELAKVPNEFVHEPWKMTSFQQMEYECKLGVDYPNPIVPPSRPNPHTDRNNRGRGGHQSKGNNRHGPPDKSRKANASGSNRHQKYEMKSLQPGSFRVKES